jgi:hypothetical protein
MYEIIYAFDLTSIDPNYYNVGSNLQTFLYQYNSHIGVTGYGLNFAGNLTTPGAKNFCPSCNFYMRYLTYCWAGDRIICFVTGRNDTSYTLGNCVTWIHLFAPP